LFEWAVVHRLQLQATPSASSEQSAPLLPDLQLELAGSVGCAGLSKTQLFVESEGKDSQKKL